MIRNKPKFKGLLLNLSYRNLSTLCTIKWGLSVSIDGCWDKNLGFGFDLILIIKTLKGVLKQIIKELTRHKR
ncbi:hypothetical protein HpBT335_09160 [Helicobacter pylori]